ncbi:MAG: hypothetical protein Q8K60_04415 [Parachlamydiaceae bacterium]|nr:hypothetical protein [Parachlamydiaceae bacterium]
MSRIKYILTLFILMIASQLSAQIGQETRFDRELRSNDDQALRAFVESKENIDVKKKSQNLDISGDVRLFWQNVREKGLSLYGTSSSIDSSDSIHENYRNFRGGDHVGTDRLPLSTNIFDVEFNLKFKYNYKKSWAMAHLQFDNPAGAKASVRCRETAAIFNRSGSHILSEDERNTRRNLKGSGAGAGIYLKKAYAGYNVYADGDERFDIEVGRRKLNDVFISEIQFSNYFDGLLFKYAQSLGKFASFYWNLGGFVIDQRVNHFGYVTEFGFLDIYDTGLDLRYSFISWNKNGKNRCLIRNAYGTQFQNSQFTLTYLITPTIGCYELPVELYSGLVINHAAEKNKFTHGKKENLGWYAGVYIGNSDKEGDWSIDIEYAVVQAQAVPDPDVASIGRGNIFNEFIYDVVLLDGLDSGSDYYEFIPRRGNGNFIGWKFEYLYLLTDNLSLDVIYQWSRAKNPRIGGHHNYYDFNIEVIYAF